jgi:hypothetical protein
MVDDNVGEDRSKQMAMKTMVGSTARLGRETARDEEIEQSRRALPKNLIRPLPYRIAKGEWFRRPALPFVDARRRPG